MLHPAFTGRRLSTALVVALAMLPGLAIEQELALDYRMNEHIVQVPAGAAQRARLETTVFRPNGPGPFPLLIINHGKDSGQPSAQPRDRFYYMAAAFVARGYTVLVPMRQGFADSTGTYQDRGCDMRANGYLQAEDIRATLDYARTQPWIDATHIVVAGQSYGGLATLALGTQALPRVRGLINVAGGLRDDRPGCAWQAALQQAFAEYGARSTVPSLWLYGKNDSLFDPALAQRLHAAYSCAGGSARLISFGAFKRDAHGMLASRDGARIWLDETLRFLDQVDMPTTLRYQIAAPPTPPRTDFARLDDVAAVPYLAEPGRRAYAEYLTRMHPRAFAISPSGVWTWSEEGEAPAARALATCSAQSSLPCALYSVDDDIVWNGATQQRAAAAHSATALASTPQAPAVGARGSTTPLPAAK